MGSAALATGRDKGYGIASVNNDLFSAFKAASLSFLDNTFGEKGAYSTQFRGEVSDTLITSVTHGVGILQGARGEMAGGWMVTTRGLISAELFADFLEMAEHLLDEGYKDAAAVMIGSTLEEHLRQLANANGIAVEELNKQNRMVPRKSEIINADLAKAVYSKLDQSNVTAWLALRNRAAHGKYQDYNDKQVRAVLDAVREFIARVHV